MTDHPQNAPQRVFVRGGAHRSSDTTASSSDALTAAQRHDAPAAPAPAPTAEAERPVGGIDVLYFEDDPSDMELVLEMPDGQVVAVALTEMKATRLRRALEAQQLAAARMRHELDGGTPDTFEPLTAVSADMGGYSAAEYAAAYDGAEYSEDKYSDDEDDAPEETLSVRERVNRRMDVAGVKDAAGEAIEKDVKGIPVGWFVLGVLAVSLVLSIVSTLSGWL